MEYMWIVAGFLATLFMGATLGIMGAGGSILTVPILIYLFNFSPTEATFYSLFIVGVTALFGSISHLKQKNINIKVAALFVIPSFIGVLSSRFYFLKLIPTEFIIQNITIKKDILILFTFSVLMVSSALSMILSQKTNLKPTPSSSLNIFIKAYVIGTITGFVGAGGGFLIIPALVMLLHVPMKQAIRTSLLIITFNSLFGFGSEFLLNYDHFEGQFLILPIAILAIIGLFAGQKISKNWNTTDLKKRFGWFVLILGTLILMQQLKLLLP